MNKTIEEIAGYMSERHVWQMLHEVATALAQLHSKGVRHRGVNPMNICWDELHFSLAPYFEDSKRDEAYKYEAPEAADGRPCLPSDVWSLGATAFYMHMGCHVFSGRGGKAQTAETPVPFMRKEQKDLSELVYNCLKYNAEDRPTAEQIAHAAEECLEKWPNHAAVRPRKAAQTAQSAAPIGHFWPEEMA